MTRTDALARLAAYEQLYRVHAASLETCTLPDVLPASCLQWYAAAPLLLAFCRQSSPRGWRRPSTRRAPDRCPRAGAGGATPRMRSSLPRGWASAPSSSATSLTAVCVRHCPLTG